SPRSKFSSANLSFVLPSFCTIANMPDATLESACEPASPSLQHSRLSRLRSREAGDGAGTGSDGGRDRLAGLRSFPSNHGSEGVGVSAWADRGRTIPALVAAHAGRR